MRKSSVELLVEPIGFEIGTSDDVVQSKLLNSFCKGLHNSMQSRELEMQLCYITDKLDSNAENVLLQIVEFIKLKRSK